jgi:hypothetical protein
VLLLVYLCTCSMVHCSCREISSGLWAYSTCQLQPPPALLTAAADAICGWDKLQGGEAKHLVTLGWALAKLKCKDRRVFAALAAALVPHVGQLSTNQVSVVLWAFGRAAFKDEHLLQQLASRTMHLLQQQQQQQQQQGQQQQQQREAKLSRGAAKQLRDVQFDATTLSSTVWGLSALQRHEPGLMAAAASLAAAAPLVYEFKPYEAVNLLKGFAAAASAVGDADGESSSIDSSMGSSIFAEQAAMQQDQQQQEALQQTGEAAAAAAAVPNRDLAIQLWPAACAVTSAALRRLDEATPQCVVRLMWCLAALHQAAVYSSQQQQAPPLSAAVTQDGRIVFEQLAAAMQRWSSQPPHPVGVTVAAWSLVMAQESGLVSPLLLLQQPGTDGHVATVLGQLLESTMALAGQQQQLKAHQVADLAAAFDRLSRPLQHSGLLQQARNSIGALTATSSSSKLAGAPTEASQAAAADVSLQDGQQQQQQQLLLGQFTAAVSALAAAARQLAAGSAAGQLSVYDVSKMLPAFGRMQVRIGWQRVGVGWACC